MGAVANKVSHDDWLYFRGVSKADIVRITNSEGREKRTDNEGNHGSAIASGGLEALDELLDLPDLNLYCIYISSNCPE